MIFSGANASLENCEVGADCLLHSGVRIGADGFGFAVDEAGAVRKKPQLLRVLLGDHVGPSSRYAVAGNPVDQMASHHPGPHHSLTAPHPPAILRHF